jgi:hypothetical protein
MPLRRVCRRQQDSRLVSPAVRHRSLLCHGSHRHRSSLGSLLEGSGVPLGADLHLTGYLEEGPYGLLLRNGGGVWELDARRPSRRLIGCEVEVTGQRAGFNGIVCDQIWPAGQPRPRRLRLDIEYLLTAAFVGYGIIALLLGLAGHFR